MKSYSFKLLTLSIALALFISGVAVGYYYHVELSVLLANYLGQGTPPLASSMPSTLSSGSMLYLNMVPEPLPLVYSDTLEEEKIQAYLKQGAVVLPLGTTFGEGGNVVVTAHSSGNQAFGPYRFAFAKLSELKKGDQFTVRTPTGIYTYQVYGKEIVWPHQVDKLPRDDRSTVTLVTCWPLWTNFKRLLVHSELIKTEPVQ